jgi:hypothetical protein
VDWTTLTETGAPLIVALFAVWLGYRYHRVLADIESRRVSYVRVLGHLNRMMDCIEQTERLSFISLLIEEVDSGIPDGEIEGGAQDFAIAAVVDLCATLGPEPPWFPLLQQGEEGVTKLVHEFPPLLRAIVHARFEEERRLIRDEGPALVLGTTPIWRDRKSLGVFGALARLTFHLARVYHAINPKHPARVDWKPINALVLAVGASIVGDLGTRTGFNIGLVQRREHLPWPKDTPVVELTSETHASQHDDGIDWDLGATP